MVVFRCLPIRWARLAVVAFLAGTAAFGQAWTEAQPLSLGAAELRRAAASVPHRSDYPVVVLLQSERLSVDEQGRRITANHLIYRVESLSGLGAWANLEAAWSAWTHSRPEVRARVLSPDGTVTPLDPAALQEYQPNASEAEMFGDRKVIRAPLPQLQVGSLVETEIVQLEHRPFSRVGTRGTFAFVQGVPVQAYRAVLEVPAAMKLNWKWEHLSPDVMQTTSGQGRVRHLLVYGPTLPPPPLEPLEDPTSQPIPVVKFGSTPSWNAAAVEYDALVQAQLQPGALRKEALEARENAKDRRAVLSAVMAYVQRRVRYVALEFGDAAIVPAKPAEVLARGFGDCKDKSTLVVALLSELGIRAELALLRVANPWDVDPEVPGLGTFDHCIVHVPGPEAVWIDPAAQRAKVGVLPPQDQDRWALVIHRGTQTLVRTPRLSAAENRITRTVEVGFPAEGGPRITETQVVEGTEELAWRMNFGTADPQALREFLKRRVIQTYRAKELGALDLAPADDLSRPYRIRVEVEGAGIGNRGTRDGYLAMNPWPAISALEELVQPVRNASADKSEASTQTGATEVPRRRPLTLKHPFSVMHRWVVQVPEGYTLTQLPTAKTWPFGPARLEATFERKEGREVRVTYLLTCATLVWTPEEVMAARAAFRAFGVESSPVLRFQQEGEALLAGGKVKEALVAARRAVAQAPADAGARIRLARTLLVAGGGQAARQEARKAVELAPGAAQAWAALGWALQHDGFGRRFEVGWDREAALSATRKALSLEPKNNSVKWQLALLLERDARGQLYDRPEELAEASSLYESLALEVKDETLDGSRLLALVHLGKSREALALARQRVGGSTFWNGWCVALNVLVNGREAALSWSAETWPDAAVRGQALVAAGEDLFTLREYALAGDLMNQGALRHERQARVLARAELLGQVRKQERPTALRDPKVAPFTFLARLLEGTAAPEKLRECFTAARRSAWSEARLTAYRRRVLDGSGLSGQPWAVAFDALRTQAEVKVEGTDETGYLLAIKSPFLNHYFALALEEGAYRIVSVGFDASVWSRQALWVLERQDAVGAAAWIDRAMMRCGNDNTQEPTQAHPVFRVRTPGKAQHPIFLKLAAWCMLSIQDPDEEVARALKEVYEATSAPALKKAVGTALVHAQLRLGMAEAAEPVTAWLVAQAPKSGVVAELRADALLSLHRWKDLEAWATEWEAKDPTGPAARYRVAALLYQKRRAEAERLLEGTGAKATAALWQSAALALTEAHLDPAKGLEWARKGAGATEERSLEGERTLCLALLEANKPLEALDTLWRAMELEPADSTSLQAWYILGRISESLQEGERARQYYREALKARTSSLVDTLACRRLAQDRLKALGG